MRAYGIRDLELKVLENRLATADVDRWDTLLSRLLFSTLCQVEGHSSDCGYVTVRLGIVGRALNVAQFGIQQDTAFEPRTRCWCSCVKLQMLRVLQDPTLPKPLLWEFQLARLQEEVASLGPDETPCRAAFSALVATCAAALTNAFTHPNGNKAWCLVSYGNMENESV
jgi:hypothetical protein